MEDGLRQPCKVIAFRIRSPGGAVEGEKIMRNPIRHGHARVGRHTTTYTAWKSSRKKHPGQIIKRWETFENFLKDMGDNPLGKMLIRKNHMKPFSKGNCFWGVRSQVKCGNFKGWKINKEIAKYIRKLLISGEMNGADVGIKYNITRQMVSAIKTKKAWA